MKGLRGREGYEWISLLSFYSHSLCPSLLPSSLPPFPSLLLPLPPSPLFPPPPLQFPLQLLELVLQVVTLYYGGHLVMYGEMTGGELVSLLLYQVSLTAALDVSPCASHGVLSIWA